MRKPSPILHPQAHELYQYHLGVRFDPGAQAEAFLPKFGLPVISFRGAGRVAGEMRVTQQPQVWFTPQRGVNGLGGVQAGRVMFQPLLDPSQIGG